MGLKDVMKKPVFVSPDETLSVAAKLLSQHNANGLLVGSEKKVNGVITKEDLVKRFGQKDSVSDAMTRSLVVVNSNEPIETALQILKKHRINFIPVMEKNRIVGVLSSKDLLKHAEEDEEEEFLFG